MRVLSISAMAILVGLLAGYAWSTTPHADPRGGSPIPAPTTEEVEHSAYYPNCRAAWAADKAPIYRGQPGYREELDGDGDGIACEPYRS